MEKLEQKCDELTKQYEDVRHVLEQERRRHEKNHDSSANNNSSSNNNSSYSNKNATEPAAVKAMSVNKESTIRHTLGSASEPESDEVSNYGNKKVNKFNQYSKQ